MSPTWALLRHEESTGVTGGSITAKTPTVAGINTVVFDNTDFGMTVSGGLFPIPDGKTFIFEGWVPVFASDGHQALLWDETAGGPVLFGTTEDSGNGTQTFSYITGIITVTGAPTERVYSIRIATETTRVNAGGINHSFDVDNPEIYSTALLEFL